MNKKFDADAARKEWWAALDDAKVYEQRYRAFQNSDIIEAATFLAEEYDKVRDVVEQTVDADDVLMLLATYFGLKVDKDELTRKVPSKAQNIHDARQEMLSAFYAADEKHNDYQVIRARSHWEYQGLDKFDVWRYYSSDNIQGGGDEGIQVQNWLRAIFQRLKEDGAALPVNSRKLRNIAIFEYPYKTDTNAVKKYWLMKVAHTVGIDVAEIKFKDEVDTDKLDEQTQKKKQRLKHRRLYDRLFDEE